MLYINAENEYPRHIGDVQLVLPGFKDGDTLPKGWVSVKESQTPIAGLNQAVSEVAPADVEGVMTQQWLLRDLSKTEIDKRNAPATAKEKLIALGLTEAEVQALARGLVR
jgi:hypothetical protein